MNNNLAPIALFVYNRPLHTRKTIEALLDNSLASASDLFIFSDGPKRDHAIEKIEEVRAYVRTVSGFNSVTVIEREENFGLANSIIDGVTSIVNKFGRIIVLEDDLVTTPNFLNYMNEALEKYKDSDKVFSITGFSHSQDCAEIDKTYFLKLTSSWGWATWACKWKFFRKDSKLLLKLVNDKNNADLFNYDNSYDFVSMGQKQLNGEINSWAIYWYASVFCENGLTLYPAKSLAQNIGFDGSGVHCGSGETLILAPFAYDLTNDVLEKSENRKIVAEILKGKGRFLSKLKNGVKAFLAKHRMTFHFIFWLQSKMQMLKFRRRVGSGCLIEKTVSFFGRRHIVIGNNTVIAEGTWLNVNVRKPGADHIIIGNNVYIGRRNTISSSKLIDIGDFTMTSNEVRLFGANHIYSDPMKPYISTGVTCEEILKIGANVWLGGGVTVCGNLCIGHGSIIGAGSVVSKSIPPFSIAVGNPCKVIKRFDFGKKLWIPVNQIESLEELEAKMPSEKDYLVALRKDFSEIRMPMFAASTGDLP